MNKMLDNRGMVNLIEVITLFDDLVFYSPEYVGEQTYVFKSPYGVILPLLIKIHCSILYSGNRSMQR